MAELTRRRLLRGLGGLLVAPAIVRAGSLMPIRAFGMPDLPVVLTSCGMSSNSLLTINMITQEAIKLFRNSNNFIQNVDPQWDERFKTEHQHDPFPGNLKVLCHDK